MLTSHSSWEEWFPPGLGGLTYLTSHIFTMVASASLWGRRSEFQTSWVITDFSPNPPSALPPPIYSCSQRRQISYISRSSSLPHSIALGFSLALLQWYSQINSSSLPKSLSISNSGIVSFLPSLFLTFTVILTMTTQCRLLPFGCMSLNPNRVLSVVTWLFSLMLLQRGLHHAPYIMLLFPKLYPNHPPTPLSHLWLTALTLTKTPACGSMVYFLWMKGPNESAFLSHLWEEAAGCLVSSCLTSVLYIHSTPENRIKHDWE